VRTRAPGHHGRAGTDAGPREWCRGPRGIPRPVRGARATPAEAGPGAGRIATTQHRSAGPPRMTSRRSGRSRSGRRPGGRPPRGNRDRWSGQRQKGRAASAMPLGGVGPLGGAWSFCRPGCSQVRLLQRWADPEGLSPWTGFPGQHSARARTPDGTQARAVLARRDGGRRAISSWRRTRAGRPAHDAAGSRRRLGPRSPSAALGSPGAETTQADYGACLVRSR
jgi:hypothetical protein